MMGVSVTVGEGFDVGLEVVTVARVVIDSGAVGSVYASVGEGVDAGTEDDAGGGLTTWEGGTAPNPALVHESPVHLVYRVMVPAPPQNSDSSPAQLISQFPTTPGIGLPLSGIELPPFGSC